LLLSRAFKTGMKVKDEQYESRSDRNKRLEESIMNCNETITDKNFP
jgi:hypothetical protein